ncbi:MAG: exodeoxyribonuclease V subunit gamma [Dokdonella sp.]|uniref:exodeoxyribonuclease V subunit gamma n=1 Tax=Dokdonella sp. TaxID=2291710 RepID=UPI003F81A512
MSEQHGLIVHRGSRVERLAQTLAGHLEAELPANPLQPQRVVVAHPGMQRWLLGFLARRPPPRGGHPIAANIEMVLPWQWLLACARDFERDAPMGEEVWRQDALRWLILDAIEQEPPDAVAGTDTDPRRRFRFADHLAGVYTQYLIYRADWIREWERTPRAASDWQAALWREVRRRAPGPHRVDRMDRLRADLARAERVWPPLHVFGVSHLARDMLAALRTLAERSAVHLYFPDPCREHWSYLRNRRELLRLDADPQALYFEVGHPLLVALGRVAQDFCLVLDDLDATEERDALDEEEVVRRDAALLDRLQASIRCMQPDEVGTAFRESLPAVAEDEDATTRDALLEAGLRPLRADASLRVHACHTRLRELEVLKDALLRALADDSRLRHRDIVVMAPDMSDYAPYLPAVFGEPARHVHDPLHVPWHIVDIGLAGSHPLIGAFTRLLDLAESRFAVSDVLGLLDVPAIARRYGFDEAGRETLEQWLRRARVAWGLDAAMKEQVGGAAVATNSWQFGFDRLYAGLIAGNEADDVLVDGVLPLDGVSGGATSAIGELDRLLAELRRLRTGFAEARPLADWAAWLAERVDALFLLDPRDDAERAAGDALRRRIADLSRQARDAGLATPQPWAVVREAVLGMLAELPERQPFLLGGVTFCGLVPQRSIPFKVVCLLGMNEGEFPRSGSDAGLNRMAAGPRRGDRETRNEDRHLFLEALMAARERLHVSYIGIGVHDGKRRNPASPLAELLQFLDEQHAIPVSSEVARPWHVAHPLQPFDGRYYERDARGAPAHDERLYSYDATWLVPARDDAALARSPFIEPAPPAAAAIGDVEVSLQALRRFWRDPARGALDAAGIGLDALDQEAWPDREPLESRAAPLERFDRRLLFDALAASDTTLPDTPPRWLAGSGQLPAGAIGAEAYAAVRAAVNPLLAAAREWLGGAVRADALAIDLDLGDGITVAGRIARLFRRPDGTLALFDAKPSGESGMREWLAFHIDWAALRLACGDQATATFLDYDKDDRCATAPTWLAAALAQEPASLRAGLRRLIELWRGSERRPLLFFPRTAWAYATNAPERRLEAARERWLGDENVRQGERDYAPGHARLLARDLDLLEEEAPEHAVFVATVAAVADVLDPARAVLFAPPRRGRAA